MKSKKGLGPLENGDEEKHEYNNKNKEREKKKKIKALAPLRSFFSLA